MNDSSRQAIEILSVTAPGLARLAAERTVERIAGSDRYGPQPVDVWREHLVGRLEDLALVLSVKSGGQFAQQVGWARVTFASRGLPDADLRTSVECLREVLATELPEEAARPASDCLDDTLARWDTLGAPEPSALCVDDEAGRLAAGYVLALLEGDRQQACDLVLHAVREGRLTARDAVLAVCLPAQKELGRMWHLDEITVAEEHFVSATTVRLLSQIMALAPRVPRVGRTLVAATVVGNEHDIGLRAVCDLFEMERVGVSCSRLGTCRPTTSSGRSTRSAPTSSC
ncbi:MAG: cobalamin B12-binding domain-containing protein [Planctomycetota bacterium]